MIKSDNSWQVIDQKTTKKIFLRQKQPCGLQDKIGWAELQKYDLKTLQ